MRVVISILTITLAFLVGFGFATPLQQLPGPRPYVIYRPGSPDAFSETRRNNAARRTSSAISLKPQSSKIRPRVVDYGNWGKWPALGIPVAVTNSSEHEASFKLAHEQHGGIWLMTDLCFAVRPIGESGFDFPDNKSWVEFPGYLVGMRSSADDLVKLTPGETKSFEIRLKRPSDFVSSETRAEELRPGKYSIKFLLFFLADGAREYVESQTAEIEVEK